MAAIQTLGKSNEWYTPPYIFEALGEGFDLDVAHPPVGRSTYVPCLDYMTKDALSRNWGSYFVWMNPPFGGRNGMIPWMDKFFEHGNGIALSTDTTSSIWWQSASKKCDAVLFVKGRVKFLTPDKFKTMPNGDVKERKPAGDDLFWGEQPVNGTTLWASGGRGVEALIRADERRLGTALFTARTQMGAK